VFLAHIVRIRKRAAITQLDLAARLKKPQSFVSKSETGERRIDFVELVEWLNALGHDPEDFFKLLLKDAVFQK
jgi:transcriptional regulator with XRE-family HTH domain